MAASILLRTISAVDDKRIVLSNSAIARALTVGSTWNVLRVGVRWSATDAGANITSTPRLYLGLCSGTSAIPGDATPTNSIGIRTSVATWTRSAGPPVSYTIGEARASKCVGGTYTDSGVVAGFYILAAPSTGNRSCHFVTITKGSPNYTVGLFSLNSSASSDVTKADFLALMEQASPSRASYVNNNGFLAFDEVAGALDSAFVYWDRTAADIEVSDIAVSKFS